MLEVRGAGAEGDDRRGDPPEPRIARAQVLEVTGRDAHHGGGAAEGPAFAQPGLQARELVFPAAGRPARAGPLVIVGAPGVLHVDHVGHAEPALPQRAQRDAGELGGGEEHQVEALPLQQPAPAPPQVIPGAQAERADAQPARPARGEGPAPLDPQRAPARSGAGPARRRRPGTARPPPGRPAPSRGPGNRAGSCARAACPAR